MLKYVQKKERLKNNDIYKEIVLLTTFILLVLLSVIKSTLLDDIERHLVVDVLELAVFKRLQFCLLEYFAFNKREHTRIHTKQIQISMGDD
jgi:hypothetical protein